MSVVSVDAIPTPGGVCKVCTDNSSCPMKVMLPLHRKNVLVYGEFYKDTRPDLWDEESIDEPVVENGDITWCPLFCEHRVLSCVVPTNIRSL